MQLNAAQNQMGPHQAARDRAKGSRERMLCDVVISSSRVIVVFRPRHLLARPRCLVQNLVQSMRARPPSPIGIKPPHTRSPASIKIEPKLVLLARRRH